MRCSQRIGAIVGTSNKSALAPVIEARRDSDDVRTVGTTFLASIDDDWRDLIATIGPCRWEPHAFREPYEALVRSIAYQQIHGRAAAAILQRFLALYPGTAFPAPELVLITESRLLRDVGFSAAKIASIRAIAHAAASGVVPRREQAQSLADTELIAQLVTIRGVGQWTVEMMLMHTLGRPDILPVDDFGVREGYRRLKKLKRQPTPRALARIGLAWLPYRSIASWYLWRAADKA